MMRDEKRIKEKRLQLRELAQNYAEDGAAASARDLRLKADVLDWVLCSVGQI